MPSVIDPRWITAQNHKDLSLMTEIDHDTSDLTWNIDRIVHSYNYDQEGRS